MKNFTTILLEKMIYEITLPFQLVMNILSSLITLYYDVISPDKNSSILFPITLAKNFKYAEKLNSLMSILGSFIQKLFKFCYSSYSFS